ncbi:MAG: hypothetical protein ABW185_04045 [Sedimenticola sp.]
MDKLYVPNPQKWVRFFDKVAEGKATFGQSGGARKMEIIPIDKCASTDKTTLPIEAVAPAEQTVQQAASELKRENINPEAVSKMIQKTEKRRRKRTSTIAKIAKKKQVGGSRKQIGVRRKKQIGGRKKRGGGAKKRLGGRKKQSGGRKRQLGGRKTYYKDIFDS